MGIWDKTASPTRHVSDALEIERWQIRVAIHKIKAANNLGPTDKIIIYDDGKVTDTNGVEIGNIFDESDKGVKAFVTFRVAGDGLLPDEVTTLLRVNPTHAHRRDEQYSTGKSTITGSTGVWLFSTDRIILSGKLYDHLGLILNILGLSGSSSRAFSSEGEEFSIAARFLRLKNLLDKHSLTATLTLFWHGPHAMAYPKVPDKLIELFNLIPVKVETDFDKDEDSPRRTPKVA